MKKALLKILVLCMAICSVFCVFTACNTVEFKVDFIVDGEIYATINTNGGETIKMPTDPTKEGYAFDGWYWDNDTWKKPFTANSLLDAPLSDNMSVYAKWVTPSQVTGTGIEILNFEQISDKEYYIKVSNSTESISFGTIVTIDSHSSWSLSTDIYGNNTIASKTATLNIGDNIYYAMVTDANGATELYTFKIRRRPIYNLIFDTNGGSSVAKQEIEEDSFAVAPTTEKTGYTFVSWNYDFANPITDNTIVVATWSANQYKINYNADGGDISNSYTEVTYDEEYILSEPKKRGYAFAGWYNDKELVENGTYLKTEDITVKAKWDIVNYAISYDLKGGSVSVANPTSYTVEADNIILNNPAQLGYEFIGWTGTDVLEPSKGVIIYSNSIGERKYTANWEFNGYKINYHLNEGVNSTGNPIGFTIASPNIYLNNPTREGYIFGGWFTTETFDADSKITTITTGTTGDIDIYAKWTPVTYSIKFNANGGDGLMNNQLFTYDVEQNLDNNKYNRFGYTFLGWSDVQNDLTAKYEDAAKLSNMANVQGDIVELFAIWEAISSTVSFDKGISEGGTDSVVATYGGVMPTAIIPEIPFGYAFDGYFDIDGVQYYDSLMISARAWNKVVDTTLYARFTAKGSTITFDKQGGINGSNSVNAVYDSKMPQAVAPTKAGYDFKGYYYQENGQGTRYYDAGMTSVHNWDREYDATLYAYYTPSEYMVSFDFNGGVCLQTQIAVTYLEQLPDLSAVPTRTGYIFLGYFDAKNNGTKYYNADLTHDLSWDKATGAVLYAHWEAISYQVKFDGNKSTSGTMSNEAFVYDVSKNLTANSFAKIGYSFVNWNTKADGSGVSYTNNQSVKNLSSVDGEVITLYAQWSAVSYSINYNLNGGSNHNDNPKTYTIEDTIILKSPSKTGYTFAGWSDGGKIDEGTTGALTFTASWTANTYTVTFDKQGGTSGADTVVVTYDSAMPVCTAPENSGYDFEGYSDENGTQYYNASMGSVRVWDKAENATLYARYKGTTYTITFDKQGGSNGTNSIVATFNSTVPTATAPSRTGYAFQGYFDSINGGGKQYYSNSMGKLSVWDKKDAATLYAYWTANNYNVSFNANSGTETQSSVSATYDSAMPVITTVPTRTGYTFLGYFDSSNGGKKYYNADLTSAADWDKTSATTLYANWQGITYQVKFDKNGGTSGSMSNETFTYDASKALTTNAFSKTGYYFAGWTTNADGTGTSYTNGQSVSNLSSINNAVVILYAKWIANTYTVTLCDTETLVDPVYTVSFNLNGASGNIPSQTITTSNGLTYPTIPTRSGYVFGGWYTTSSCSTLFDFSATVTKDTTVYAKWLSYSGTGILSLNGSISNISAPSKSSTSSYKYYAFVPLVSGSITLYSTGSSDSYGYLYNSSKSQLTYNDDGGSNNNFSITYSVTAGTLYYVAPCAYGSSSITLTLCMSGASMPVAGGKAKGETTAQNVTYDSAFTLSTDCAKDGYTFAGWYDDVGGTGTQYTDKNGNSVKVWDKAVNTTLYAKWIAYTLTTEKNIANAGTVSAYENTNVTAGTSKTITATTNIGYTWIGWYNGDELLTNDVSYTFTMPEQSIVYTAKWSVNKYTITFVSNGGSSVELITQDYNTAVTAPNKPTWAGKSFVGWFDKTLTTEYTFTTMPAESITLYAKWIEYAITLTCDDVDKISVSDVIDSPATYHATAIDTDGENVSVTAQLIYGVQEAGGTVNVNIVATGKYGVYKMQELSDIKVYGTPTLNYNTEKDYFNLSNTLNASLFNATATDTFGDNISVYISVKEIEYEAGDIVTVVISAIDVTGNEIKAEINGVKVYGTPVITRNTEKNDMKATDNIDSVLFGVSAVDSFGEALNVTTSRYSGSIYGGNTIKVRSYVTDSKGNSSSITYSIKVYGLPTISNATTTAFNSDDEITLSALGIVAKDSFNKVLDNVTLELTSGEQVTGATLTYLVTATDHLGNVQTKEISGIKIYDTPTLTFDTMKTAIKDTDIINAALLSATAKDSQNNNLSVSVTVESGTVTGGNIITLRLTATDLLGNEYSVISQEIRVYSATDIDLNYISASATSIKISSKGEEFNANATDSFGNPCEVAIEIASGYTLAGGNIVSLYLVATDVLGNTVKSDLITDVKVYDTPVISYRRSLNYICYPNETPQYMFRATDSFGDSLMVNIELLSGVLAVGNCIEYKVSATDKVGNHIEEIHSLYVVNKNEIPVVLDYAEEFGALYFVSVPMSGYSLPVPTKTGYRFLGWYVGKLQFTDGNGVAIRSFDDTVIYFLTPSWEIIEYSISYNLDGGTNNANNPETYTVEDSVTLSEPTKIGYTFTGWSNGGKIAKGSTEDKSFTATWEIIIYTINYELDGGTNNVNNPNTYTVEDSINLLEPTKLGYTFTGWSNGGKIAKGETEDKSFTASWEINIYNISYVLDGGVNSANNPATYTVEDDITLSAPTRLGYTFTGWSNGGRIAKGETEDKTFAATWEIIIYNISYILDGGTNSANNPSTYTVEDNVMLSEPTKLGYAFTGWSNGGKIAKGETEDKSFTASWEINIYNISYVLDGGTNNVNNPSTYTVEDSITLLEPTRLGYTFTGWSNGGKIATGETEDKSFTATWEIINYTINYELDGGVNSANNPSTYTVEDSITLSEPTKLGYTFTGWSNSGTITKGSTEDKTFTASWVFYTLTTDVNNENAGTIMQYIDKKITAGESVTLTATTNEGYSFDGWYNGETKLATSLRYVFNMPSASVTYTAKWTAITYNVNYVLHGGTNNSNNPKTYTIESETIVLSAPTKLGYTFTGWNNSGVIEKGETEDKTFTASWEIITYTITYELDGGTNNANNPNTYTVEDSITLLEPTRLGYMFTGWSNGGKIDKGETEDKVFTASWEINIYNISYVLNGGTNSANNPSTYTVEDSVTLLEPTRLGYTFKGWSNGGKVEEGSTNDKTFTANWEIITYSINYNLNGGTAENLTEYNVDTDTFILNNPTRIGYSFKGWSGTAINNNSLNVTITCGSVGNRSYIANWEIINYTITYVLAGGTNSANNPATYTVEDNITLSAPTKLGYTFTGWSNGGTILTGEAEDKTFTATWEIITYNINYELDGGVNNVNNPSTYTVEDSIALSEPTKFGYTFTGWSNSGTITKGSTEDKTFTASWVFYTLTTDVNNENAGTIMQYIDKKITAGESVTLTATTNEGYSFDGWYNGETKLATSLRYVFNMPSASVTYTAKWTAISYNVNYVLNGGTNNANNPKTYTIESETIVLSAPTKLGYTFTGWSNGGTIVKGETEDKSFTATWEIVNYTINYELDGGTNNVNNPNTYTVEDKITLLAPTKSGYVFKSWSNGGTIPKGSTGNKTISATFDAIFNVSGGSVTGLTNYGKTLSEIIIPNTINGATITNIGDYAFYNCNNLTNITIPDNITNIGKNAFSGCANLTSVIIPDSVINIDSWSFYNCKNLTSIILGSRVEVIGNYGFSSCKDLTSIIIPNSVTSIGEKAFSGCSGLTSVTIGNSVETIGNYAFEFCWSLTNITIPDRVTSIGDYAFSGCSGLTSVTVGNSVETIGERVFSDCTCLASVTLGSRVEVIGNYGFSSCKDLTSIIIPNSVTIIGDYAFSGCRGLTSVIIGNSVEVIGDYAFEYCNSLVSVTLGNSVINIGNYAFKYCSSLPSITIPESVISIGDGAFCGCSFLQEITIPFVGSSRSVTTASRSVFFGYIFGSSSYTGGIATHQGYSSGIGAISAIYYIPSSLKTVTITGGNILYGAFSGCSGLTSVTIGNSVEVIGDDAFSNCSSLPSITIPESVISIGYGAFRGCSFLQEITIPFVGSSKSATIASSSTLFGCIFGTNSYTGGTATKQYYSSSNYITYYIPTSLKTVTVTDGNLLFGSFSYCCGLTSIIIADSVTSIGKYAFLGCSSLISITIGNRETCSWGITKTNPNQINTSAMTASSF